MGKIKYPPPVKLFIALIYEREEIKRETVERLIRAYNRIDFESDELIFNFTDYYKEIGDNLKRRFLSLERLIECDRLPQIKIETNMIEDILMDKKEKRRLINIDPGYLTPEKVVMATTKNYSHRPYLGKGIYAELTYRYKGRSYQPLIWTYPDYRRNKQIEIFNHIREIYMKQRQVEKV